MVLGRPARSSPMDQIVLIQSSLRLDLGSYRLPQLHCWILPSNLVDCVVPKNRAGLSTHAAPGSPLTFIQKVAHWLKGGEWVLLLLLPNTGNQQCY